MATRKKAATTTVAAEKDAPKADTPEPQTLMEVLSNIISEEGDMVIEDAGGTFLVRCHAHGVVGKAADEETAKDMSKAHEDEAHED